MRKALTMGVVAVALAGCASGEPRDSQLYGAAGGAALGAGIGRAVAHYTTQGTLVGLAAGALIGYAAGTPMDQAAEEKQAHAMVSVAETGKAVSWTTEKGNRGTVSPAGDGYADRQGRPCRPLKQDISLHGDQINRVVTACKAVDGTWIVTEYQPDKAG